MGKKLAIKGHSTRGKEVIELLEMMGGINDEGYVGTNTWKDEYYFLDNGYIRAYDWGDDIKFTLEEFLEKYPFKVGDKAVYTKYGDNCDDYPVTIVSMKWTGTTIEYTFNDCVTCLAKDLKMWTGEPDEVISGIYLNSCDYADEVELNLGDYEIEVRDGRTFAVKKKPKYPKTYAECAKIMNCPIDGPSGWLFNFDANIKDTYYREIDILMGKFIRLRICRDAYWKIYGEQMGLDGPWKANFTQGSGIKYNILFANGEVIWNRLECEGIICSRVLAFPTPEIRDEFYDNFKDLIEECKELL